MADAASSSSGHYASSSSSSYLPSPRHASSTDRRVSSVSQHRPPPLDLSTRKNDEAQPRRPRSQPVMASSGEAAAVITARSLLPPTPGSASYVTPDDEYGGPRHKRRGRSTDVEEVNEPSIERLSLYTPTTTRSDGLREAICLCAKAPKVPRPRNAFILYRQYWQGHFVAQNPGLANPEISKLIGEKWHEQPESVKSEWRQLAEEEKIRHQRQYPDYQYKPRRGGKNAGGRPTSSRGGGGGVGGGDAPGRCPKCGGRYIATPRTPTTPFSVASPPSSKRPPNMQPFVSADHSRHASGSGGVHVDSHGRRYTQPSRFGDVEEDYPMSPLAGPPPGLPPDAKRRRYNGPPVHVPGSPRAGYGPLDHRYQQHPSTVSGAPISATGYGPAHVSRLAQQHHPHPHPHSHPHHHPQGLYMSPPTDPRMQPPPPPRQPMGYQPVSSSSSSTAAAAATTTAVPGRSNSNFNESLRLPPLQTQMHESPTTMARTDPGARQVVAAGQPRNDTRGHGGGSGVGGGVPVRQQSHQNQNQHQNQNRSQHQQKQQQQQQPPYPAWPWPFQLKLDVLRSISPPLQPAGGSGGGGGSRVFETRGAIVAVEGAVPTAVLKDVAAVIERALSASAEFAVRVWSEDTSTAIAHSSPEPHASSGGSGGGSSHEAASGNTGENSNSAKVAGGGSEHGGATAQGKVSLTMASSSSSSLISPFASYVARMLKWHKTSEDLVRYITSHPTPPQQQQQQQQQQGRTRAAKASNSNNNNNTNNGSSGSGGGNNNGKDNGNEATSSPRLPIAVIADGYSLTSSDRYAGALHANDGYYPDDHWRWVASLWRGVVGADLTVYVKKTAAGADEGPGGGNNNNSSVEMAKPGVMVLHVLEGGRVDEKLERRLGFEIAEWVRGGSFTAGFGKS